MDLNTFSVLWPELTVKKRDLVGPVIALRDILVKSLGETERGGRRGISFEHVNDDLTPYILRPEQPRLDGSTHCYWWNEEKEEWQSLGDLFLRKEWGVYQLARFWKTCGIQFANGKKISFESAIDRCLGEKSEGLLFIGKGVWEGESMILKLEEEERLAGYWDSQKCYFLDRDSGEWKFFGWLLKSYFRRLGT